MAYERSNWRVRNSCECAETAWKTVSTPTAEEEFSVSHGDGVWVGLFRRYGGGSFLIASNAAAFDGVMAYRIYGRFGFDWRCESVLEDSWRLQLGCSQ